ncbi:hypothetical protein Vafri_14749 [Volvox africanus]|uniref:Serine hydrolase domain-containing protein n=1 Tax=Volvox africanus TaxID=51714 RepID=A0A8J4BEV9_9CHLO|nr:hypothetical protein Vafri_14749 [Volvox africanus]
MNGSKGYPNTGRQRVLCIHSFRTSGKIFQQQLQRAGLLEALSDLVEFVFVDAPHPASGPIPRDVRPYFEGPYYEWFTAESVGDRVEFDEAKMKASERFLMALLAQQGPFDGLIGFSQGAAMSGALVALQRSGLRAELSTLRPLRFCILFAGLKSRHPDHLAAFDALSGKVPCPSLHVFGDKDALKNPHCTELADSFRSATVLLHQRGHVIPVLHEPQLAIMRAFIQATASAPEPPPPDTHIPAPRGVVGQDDGAEVVEAASSSACARSQRQGHMLCKL